MRRSLGRHAGSLARLRAALMPARLRSALMPAGAVLLAILPFNGLTIPGIFDGPLNSPGTLQLLALCLLFGGLAVGYDLLFGRTGLLSFGHALFIALGGYGTVMLVEKAGLPLWQAALAAIGIGTCASAALGAVALCVKGIAFSMVTLAFAQVGAVLVARNPGGSTGGEEGLPLTDLPDLFVGVRNTVNLYWLALGYLVIVLVIVGRVVSSPTGRVLAGLRDDERRVGVLGLDPYRFKLVAVTLSGFLASAGGVVYVLVVGGASPHLASSELTLGLLVMVVLGGPGTKIGPVLGGVLYVYLDHRLTGVSTGLPGPLHEPLFVLGVVFILAVYFFPGGLGALRLPVLRRASAPRVSAPPAPSTEAAEPARTP